MHYLPARIENTSFPEALQSRLVRAVVPGLQRGESLAIRIVMDDSGLVVRQFSYFLFMLDRLYARMNPLGIYAYAKLEDSHLVIDHIEKGSVDVIIQEFLKHLDPPRIVLIWSMLKYLPKIIVSASTSISNLAHAYKEFQEGVNVRLTNQNLRKHIAQDEALSRLDRKDLALLTRIMTYLYSKDSWLLIQAGKFVERHIRSITIEREK